MIILWAPLIELIIDSMSSCPNNKLYRQCVDLGNSVDMLSKTVFNNYYRDLHISKIFDVTQEAIDSSIKQLGKVPEIYNNIKNERKIIKKVLDKCEANHNDMLQAIYGIDKKVKDIQESVLFDINLLSFTEQYVNEFTARFNNFVDGAKHIDNLYTEFLKFYKDPTQHNKQTVQKFIDACFSSQQGPIPILTDMSKALIGGRGAFDLITENLVEDYILATRRVSTLEYMHNLVLYFITTEIKAALMIASVEGIAILTNPNNTSDGVYKNYMEYVPERINSVVLSLITYAPKCSGRYWIHDTHKHRIGYEYVAFNHFLKGFYFRDTSCSYAGRPINSVGVENDRSDCQVQNFNTCNGTLHCLPGSGKSAFVDICYSAASKNRNYDYVLLNNTVTRDCSGTKMSYTPNEKCIDCLCYCEESEIDSDIHISLDEMVSDTRNNRIVTGVRFGKYNGTITLDIQETQLTLDGSITENSAKWIINKGVRKFKFKYLEKQELHLGEIKTDNDKVVTGVRFEEVSNGIELQIRINKLVKCPREITILSTSFAWIKLGLGLETKINLDWPLDKPNRGEKKRPAYINSFSKQSVKISLTSFEKDGAQTVIPFFDTRQVVLVHPLPLCGIGLVYKTSGETYGGFIAPYIILADYSSKIDLKPLIALKPKFSNGPTTSGFKFIIIMISLTLLMI